MSRETVIGLAYTDREEVDAVLEELSQTSRLSPGFVKGALRVHAKVRARGFPEVWERGHH
jgi:hypothetical protein